MSAVGDDWTETWALILCWIVGLLDMGIGYGATSHSITHLYIIMVATTRFWENCTGIGIQHFLILQFVAFSSRHPKQQSRYPRHSQQLTGLGPFRQTALTIVTDGVMSILSLLRMVESAEAHEEDKRVESTVGEIIEEDIESFRLLSKLLHHNT